MDVTKTNIVLIGMPGSGKTTVGRLLAEKLHYSFVDTDECIVEQEQQSISTIFEKQGEKAFREMESFVCQKIAALQQTVVSTGGGVVLNARNMKNLSSSGVVVFIDRPVEKIIEDIEDSSRPLLKEGKEQLYTLYSDRIESYRKHADVTVTNLKAIPELVEDIADSVQTQGGTL